MRYVLVLPILIIIFAFMTQSSAQLTLTADQASYALGTPAAFTLKNGTGESVFVFRKIFPADLEWEGQVLERREAEPTSGSRYFTFGPVALTEDAISAEKKRPPPEVLEIKPGDSLSSAWRGASQYPGTYKIKIFYETASTFQPNKYYEYSFAVESNEFEIK